MANNIKVDDNFILDIKRLGINGEGIGFYNHVAIFVDGAIPGEGHNVTVTKVLDKMAFAKTVEIKHISEDRKIPECSYYNECGGCNTMHISQSKMAELKRDILIESINRYTKINTKKFEIKPTVTSNQFEYRNRSQLQVVKNINGSSVAMTKANSNIAVSIDNCLVQKNVINELNNKICNLIDKLNVSIFSYKNNKGIIRYITIRVNKKGEALVCIVCFEKSDKVNELAKEVIKLDNVIGVYKSFNNNLDSGAEIVGKDIELLEGKACIVETLGKIKYQIYPNTFFQLNSEQAEAMYDIVLKSCKLSFKERVLDAYCGVGSIGLYLAHNAKEVIGIEYNKDSVIAATENAKLNKINNAKFMQGNAHELLPKLIKDGVTFDCIVVDPPRTGLDDKFINAILESNVKRLIYVSCNPSTLAKNLGRLIEKYNINSITPIDMFPNTALIESVTVLTLK
jgi:23S rRNA (uracil-5-)-methyltransferase RumA